MSVYHKFLRHNIHLYDATHPQYPLREYRYNCDLRYSHNRSESSANCASVSASPRMLSESPIFRSASTTASLLIDNSAELLIPFAMFPALIERRTDQLEHEFLILHDDFRLCMSCQPDYRRTDIRTRHKTVRWYICHDIRLRIILHRKRQCTIVLAARTCLHPLGNLLCTMTVIDVAGI